MIFVHTVRRAQPPSRAARDSFRGLRLFSSNMQRRSFSKRQLAAIALMLDEEEKNAALSDKKKRIRVQTQKIRRRLLDSVLCRCTSYSTSHIIPHTYSPILLIFHPFWRQKQAALLASKGCKCSVHAIAIEQAQAGPDPFRRVNHSHSATETGLNWDGTESFLPAWTTSFNCTWENCPDRWRSVTERTRDAQCESAL